MRKCNNIEDVCTGVPIDLRIYILLFRLILINEIFNFQRNFGTMVGYGYEIASSGLVKTHLSNKSDTTTMIDFKCGPPSISVVPSHMAGQMQGNHPKIGSGMDFSHIWTK